MSDGLFEVDMDHHLSHLDPYETLLADDNDGTLLDRSDSEDLNMWVPTSGYNFFVDNVMIAVQMIRGVEATLVSMSEEDHEKNVVVSRCLLRHHTDRKKEVTRRCAKDMRDSTDPIHVRDVGPVSVSEGSESVNRTRSFIRHRLGKSQ